MFSTLRNTALAGLVSLLPFGAASAAPCTQATLLTYLAGGNATCTVLDKTISGVTAVGGNPAATLVTPLTTTNDPGLDFEGGSAIPTTITFTITAPSNDPITDASLAVVGFGGAPFQVTEALSNGKSLSASESSLTDSIAFASTPSLTVTDTYSGPVLSITNQFSETPVTGVPEPPSSLVLLGVGLLACALARRRA